MKKFLTSNRLTAFLYELTRDHVPLDTVRTILQQDETADVWELTDFERGEAVEALATRLLNPPKRP